MTQPVKTLVQCDFDGTVIEGDGSFELLDAFSNMDWRPLFRDYQEGILSVAEFNARSFITIKADKESLLNAVRRAVRLRPGFEKLVKTCRRRGFRFVIVSNGLRFYIDDVLRNAGIDGVEVHAAETVFDPDGLRVHYEGPDGERLDNDFKLTYTELFLSQGYRVIYLGDGASDFVPASKCRHVFATGSLLRRCERANIPCTPFEDLTDVVPVLETL